VVTGLHISKTGSALGTLGFGLGKSLSSITETGVAAATALPFTALFEGLPAAGSGPSQGGQTNPMIDVQGSLLMDDSNLGIIIREPEFFLIVYGQSSGASGATLTGHVTVQERVNPEVLAAFL
jgi:hypothetical protein